MFRWGLGGSDSRLSDVSGLLHHDVVLLG